MRLLGGSGIVRQIEPHSKVTPIIAAPIPPPANMCAAYAGETRIAGFDKPMPVLNGEIACQVANGMSPDIDAYGVVIVWISVLEY
jgi:hypothetical protein